MGIVVANSTIAYRIFWMSEKYHPLFDLIDSKQFLKPFSTRFSVSQTISLTIFYVKVPLVIWLNSLALNLNTLSLRRGANNVERYHPKLPSKLLADETNVHGFT